MEELVKQIQAVISDIKSLVEIVKNQILTEQLCSLPYWDIFGYDLLNKTTKYCNSVPACKSILLIETKNLSRGADHVKIYSFSLRQQIQSKCVLNVIRKSKIFILSGSFLQERFYT